jgi:hypothetical protein
MKQTAVEFLFNQLDLQGTLYLEDFEQAKAMEKEQIMEFTNDYVLTQCSASFEGNVTVEMSTEEYYKLTFK